MLDVGPRRHRFVAADAAVERFVAGIASQALLPAGEDGARTPAEGSPTEPGPPVARSRRGRHAAPPRRRTPLVGAPPGDAVPSRAGTTVRGTRSRRGRHAAPPRRPAAVVGAALGDAALSLAATALRTARTVNGRLSAVRDTLLPLVGRRPRGAPHPTLRVPPLVACLGALALVVSGGILGSLSTHGAGAAVDPAPSVGRGDNVSIMHRMAQSFASSPAVTLPPASAPPEPAPPALATAPVLRPHEIFGFAPYWTLPQASGFDLADVTTLAYFSVGVNSDGSIQESGPGWTGYQSQALANLVTRAHQAGDRVVLTASCFSQQALDQLAADPTAGGRLGAELVQLVEAKNLDGVNIDFEGRGPKDRAGLDTLMAGVSSAVRQADPHWQVTMDTYASSAGDSAGFYDVSGLSPSVDAFFVMAYDMNSPTTPTPTSPLSGPGFTDVEAAQQYAAVVGPSKVILGLPYYGYDWPTAGPGLGDPATGPATPLSYAQVVALGSPVYWDPATDTPWTSYQVGTQWHETFFDDPTSLALKAQLADTYHLAGLGIWAMGMEGDSPAMLAALTGSAPVVKNLPAGPAATHPTTTTTTTTTPGPYFYTGSWNGLPVTLTLFSGIEAAASLTTPLPGALQGFATNDPGAACLENGPALGVSAVDAAPGTYVVTAAPPADCTTGDWEFTTTAPPPSTPLPTPSTTPSSTTTTTTATTTSTSSTTTTGPSGG